MADKKITGLDASVALDDTDLIAVVEDVATTPVTKKSTWTLVKSFLKTYFDTLYGDMDNPMTTQGDIIYGGASGAETRLAKGTADQVLSMNAGATAPEWADASAGGISWSAVTADETMTVDTGSLANKGTLLTLTLPATSSVGTVLRVAGMNAGLWKIAQGASQYIKFGNQASTVGATGYISSVLTYDAVELVCIEANVGWVVVSSVGNINVA